MRPSQQVQLQRYRVQFIFEHVEIAITLFTIRYEAQVRGFFKLVTLFAGTVKRQHEGDLRKVEELMKARVL